MAWSAWHATIFCSTPQHQQVKLNHRRLLDAMLDIAGVPPQKFRPICSAIDKLDKEPWEAVRAGEGLYRASGWLRSVLVVHQQCKSCSTIDKLDKEPWEAVRAGERLCKLLHTCLFGPSVCALRAVLWLTP